MANGLDVADFDLTEDQAEFKKLARTFANEELAPHAESWDSTKTFPIPTLRKAAELGFGGIYVDGEFGGSGLGRKDAAIIFEQLSTGCVSTTAYLTIHNMCAWLLDSFGSQEQKKKFLSSITSMDLLTSYCLTEPNSGSDAASLKTSAKRDGDFYVLNGSKAFISGGGVSDLYFVMARTGEGSSPSTISCFLVEKGTRGISFGANEKKMGWNSQPTAAVNFDECVVPASNLIGKEGEGFKIAMKALDGGRINIGSCSIGAAQACLERSLDHVNVREQFSKPLSSLQSIQFKLAEMATDLQSARLMVYRAAELLDSKKSSATMASAMAKFKATDIGFEICNNALQIHGGYGYLQDYQVERFLRDVRVHQILEGTNEIMRLIIARQILSRKI